MSPPRTSQATSCVDVSGCRCLDPVVQALALRSGATSRMLQRSRRTYTGLTRHETPAVRSEDGGSSARRARGSPPDPVEAWHWVRRWHCLASEQFAPEEEKGNSNVQSLAPELDQLVRPKAVVNTASGIVHQTVWPSLRQGVAGDRPGRTSAGQLTTKRLREQARHERDVGAVRRLRGGRCFKHLKKGVAVQALLLCMLYRLKQWVDGETCATRWKS